MDLIRLKCNSCLSYLIWVATICGLLGQLCSTEARADVPSPCLGVGWTDWAYLSEAYVDAIQSGIPDFWNSCCIYSWGLHQEPDLTRSGLSVGFGFPVLHLDYNQRRPDINIEYSWPVETSEICLENHRGQEADLSSSPGISDLKCLILAYTYSGWLELVHPLFGALSSCLGWSAGLVWKRNCFRYTL